MNQRVCRLCLEQRELKTSHIVPKFVFRWLKKTSATGYLRYGKDMQRRAQDGLKTPLLCGGCEQKFSTWEKQFAETLFPSLSQGRGLRAFDYGPWMTMLAASLSWRSLLYLQATGPLKSFPSDKLPLLEQAAEAWRALLCGQGNSISPFAQSFIPLGYIESATVSDLPPNFNRYLGRSVAVDLVTSDTHSFIYTKLPFMVFAGVIQSNRSEEWANTSLALEGGRFGGGKEICVPGQILSYMFDCARRMIGLNKNLSEKQKALIKDTAIKNLKRVRSSKSVEAMLRDVEFFGVAAFEANDPGSPM